MLTSNAIFSMILNAILIQRYIHEEKSVRNSFLGCASAVGWIVSEIDREAAVIMA